VKALRAWAVNGSAAAQAVENVLCLEGGVSEAVAKAATRHVQGIKGVPLDARRMCFKLPLGLVHGGGSAHTAAESSRARWGSCSTRPFQQPKSTVRIR